jgi:Sec-independent protein translocase protein TatA
MLHSSLSLQQLAIVLLVVLLIFASRRLRDLRDPHDALVRELRDFALRRMPAYSAETTRGKEAEFIRDRLPKRFPTAIVVALLVLFVAAAWWLTR